MLPGAMGPDRDVVLNLGNNRKCGPKKANELITHNACLVLHYSQKQQIAQFTGWFLFLGLLNLFDIHNS